MKLQRAKPALLWLWRLAVVALVNVLVYLMWRRAAPLPYKTKPLAKSQGRLSTLS